MAQSRSSGSPQPQSRDDSPPRARSISRLASTGVSSSLSTGDLPARSRGGSPLGTNGTKPPRPPGMLQSRSASDLQPRSAPDSQPQPTSIPRTMEARFKALADKSPYPSNEEIQRSLAIPPAVDKALYYRWAINYRAERARQILEADPKSNEEAADLLKNTRYDHPADVSRLCWEINSPAGMARLPLGNYTAESMKLFCYLHFTDTLLPRDPPCYGPDGEWDITYLKCQPDHPAALPKSVHQLGQLCLSFTIDPATAQPTCFVVAVTPARRVYAIWNPIGPDPEYTHADDDIASTAYRTRPTSGKLLGFNTPCAAFLLADNIDALCKPHQGNKVLPISEGRFITLRKGSTLRFTGAAP